MRSTHLVPGFALAAALAACSGGEPAPANGDTRAPAAGTHACGAELSKEYFAEPVKTLSSDEFEGRAPGSPGGEMTVGYIKAQHERIGREPGGDGGTFCRAVPMIETTAHESTVLHVEVAGQ